MSQKKKGILLSYFNLIIGLVANVYLTPIMIVSLGDIDYSLYKVMHSLAGPLAIFHLGLATVVAREIVKNKELGDEGKIKRQNTLALSLFASVIMAISVIIVGVVLYFQIPGFYGNTYSEVSVEIGQKIFIMYIISSVFHIMTDVFSGCIIGHERYVISGVLPLGKTLGKSILQFVFLKCGFGVLFIVAIDLIIAFVTFVFSSSYSIVGLKELPKLHYFDKKQLFEIISFGVAILMQAFVNQVNNNMDIMILGSFIIEKSVITMYSSALVVYTMYTSLISVITNYFLPQATKLIDKEVSGKELTDFVIRPGRFQAVIAMACIGGFALFGQNFIAIWIGEQYMDAYWIILVLMIPVTVSLVENAAISILDAAMKRIYRSIVLVIMSCINLIVSIVLVKCFGFWGAAIGTVVSLIIGNIVLMNIYYAKTFHIEIFRMFKQIFKGILPAGLLASLLSLPLATLLPNTRIMFIVKCGVFVAVYILFLFIVGLNADEKTMLNKLLRKLRYR